MLCLDSLKDGNLLTAPKHDGKVTIALEIATVIKKLLGQTRHLKRKAPDNSSCPEIDQLKALLTKRDKNAELPDDPPDAAWDDATVAMIMEYCESVSADALEAFMEVT